MNANGKGAALVLAALLLFAAAPADAQMLVVAQQNLQFGSLTPGVPATVQPTDPARRAAFEISSRGRYRLTFLLPASLAGSNGGQVPLLFSGTDGRVEIRHRVTTFDPATGVDIHINPADQSASVYLGGRAQPQMGQRAGSYSATITMIVVQTGT
jgi:hypothetical protein